MGYEVWIQNNHATRGRKFIGKRGIGDLSGYHKRTGIRLECEIKAFGDKFSEDQLNFLEQCHASNCAVFIAWGDKDGNFFLDTYQQLLKKSA